MVAPQIEVAVRQVALTYQLPAALVWAIMQTESSGNPWAFRYEPQYRWLVGDKLTMTVTERLGQQCSWGLMQVMGAVAREDGFTGWFPQLCEPALGLAYGCRHLKKFWDKYHNWNQTIASYNAGSPVRLPDGTFRNQSYVDKVLRAWNAVDIREATL